MSSKRPKGKAPATGQGNVLPFPKNMACDVAFEEFRAALLRAQKVGSINAMRKAVSAYDRFAAIIGAD